MIAARRVNQLGGNANPVGHLPDAAFDDVLTPSLRPISFTSTACPLKTNDEFLAITSRFLNRLSSVIMSSVRPSEKYSCSESPDMLMKGSTAIEGLSDTDFGAATSIVGVPVTR